jgi:hypothetical protein
MHLPFSCHGEMHEESLIGYPIDHSLIPNLVWFGAPFDDRQPTYLVILEKSIASNLLP